MDLKAKLKEAKKTTKIAIVGGAIVIAGSWGSCQLNTGEEAAEPEDVQEAPAAPDTPAEPEAKEEE